MLLDILLSVIVVVVLGYVIVWGATSFIDWECRKWREGEGRRKEQEWLKTLH